MDRTSKILVLFCVVVFILWGPVVNHIWPPKPAERRPGAMTNAVLSASSRTNAWVNMVVPTLLTRESKAPPVFLENQKIRVEFLAKGGGPGAIVFKDYPVAGEPPAAVNAAAPTASLDLAQIGGLDFGETYQLQADAKAGRVTATVQNAQVKVIKTFELNPSDPYRMSAVIQVFNVSGSNVFSSIDAPPTLAIGTSNPLSHLDHGAALGFSWMGANNKYAGGSIYNVIYRPPLVGMLMRGTPRPYFTKADAIWAAVKNQFFALLVHSKTSHLTGIRAEAVPLPQSEIPHALRNQRAIFTWAELEPIKLFKSETKTLEFDAYLGPKNYSQLESLGLGAEKLMDYSIWAPISKLLLASIIGVQKVLRNWGLAIIAVTVLLKLIFWPLGNMSARSAKRMQALAPRFKELQEKYADDPEKKNAETWKLYSEYGVNPFGGCWPMLVQIPIFFGLYSMLRSAIQFRGAHFLWIHDLSMPDTIAYIPFPQFDLLRWSLGPIPINPMPLVMVGCQIWQMRMMPSPGSDSSQRVMLWIMPLFFLLICYNFSSALALYWTVQTLLSAVQTQWIKNQPDQPLQKVKRAKFQGLTFARPSENPKRRK